MRIVILKGKDVTLDKLDEFVSQCAKEMKCPNETLEKVVDMELLKYRTPFFQFLFIFIFLI